MCPVATVVFILFCFVFYSVNENPAVSAVVFTPEAKRRSAAPPGLKQCEVSQWKRKDLITQCRANDHL